MADQV